MSFLKFVFESKSPNTIPSGYKITHKSGKTYIRESSGWVNAETNRKLDYKSSLILNEQALNEIDEKEDEDLPVMYPDLEDRGYKIMRNSDGNWYHSGTGAKLSPEDAKPYEDRYQKEQSTPASGTDEESVMYPDLEGRGYKIMRNSDGQWYHSGTGGKLNPDEAKPYEDRYQKEHGSTKSSSSTEEKPQEAPKEKPKTQGSTAPSYQDDKGYNITRNKDGEWYNMGTGAKLSPEEAKQYEDKYQKEQGNSSSSAKDTQESPSSDSSAEPSSNIPNGYVYTSGKGNKFMFKNGTWYNLANKKPVNPSNVNMLNRSAEKAINDFNAKSDIKIGDKVKSGKGVEYTYNGTGFTSPDGKQLTGGAAQAALNKLKAEKAQSTQGTADAGSTAEPKPDETIVPGESAVDTNPPEQQNAPSTQGSPEPEQNDPNDYSAQSIINNLGDNGTDNSDSTSGASTDSSTSSTPPSTQPKDPMTELAQKIKSNKYNKQIVTLLSRGGDMDLLAADILLNGNVQEVINQLKSLNNSNTQ